MKEKINMVEDTIISNMPKVTMKISACTHRGLKVYAAEHALTLDGAIADLLARQKVSPPVEEVI